jgi:hypothetical protein
VKCSKYAEESAASVVKSELANWHKKTSFGISCYGDAWVCGPSITITRLHLLVCTRMGAGRVL